MSEVNESKNLHQSGDTTDSQKTFPTVWKCVHTLHPLEARSTPFVYGSKAISYAYFNIVRTWNCEEKLEQSLSVPAEKEDCITALAEMKSEHLVAGTEKGRIYFEQSTSWIEPKGQDSAVKQILVIGATHVIVEFNNNKKALLDVKNLNYVHDFDENVKVCRVKENSFATLRGGCVKVMSVDCLETSKYQHNSEDKNYIDVRAEKEQFLLIKHADKKTLTIWDIEKNSTSKFFLSFINTDQFKTLGIIDAKTLIVPDWSYGEGVCLHKYAYNDEEARWGCISRSTVHGYDQASSMIQVNDLIMYATPKHGVRNIDAGIHVFDKNLKCVLSTNKFTDEGASSPLALIALDGFVAIEFEKTICIIERQKYKDRLFVGEGNFSYTEAFIKKHEKLARSITATEIKTRKDVVWHFLTWKVSPTEERLNNLKNKGVALRYEINAKTLHVHFPSRRFERIHWNCPFADSFEAMSNGAFKNEILNFFDSCSKIQHVGDRVHVTLMQEKDKRGYRQKENPIVLGSTRRGYHLIKKRKFGKERYPGYDHTITSGLSSHSSNDDELREFVFEKAPYHKRFRAKKNYLIKQSDSTNYYFECSTDNDSSDDDYEIKETSCHNDESHQLAQSCKDGHDGQSEQSKLPETHSTSPQDPSLVDKPPRATSISPNAEPINNEPLLSTLTTSNQEKTSKTPQCTGTTSVLDDNPPERLRSPTNLRTQNDGDCEQVCMTEPVQNSLTSNQTHSHILPSVAVANGVSASNQDRSSLHAQQYEGTTSTHVNNSNCGDCEDVCLTEPSQNLLITQALSSQDPLTVEGQLHEESESKISGLSDCSPEKKPRCS